MRIQRIQQYPTTYNKHYKQQPINFKKSSKIADAAGCLFAFVAVFNIPIIAGLMCLNTHLKYEQERKNDIKTDKILKQISDAAYPNFVSSLYLYPEVQKLIKEEPFFFKDEYWAEKIPELTQKGIKQWQDTEAAVKKQVQEEMQAKKRHIEHVKTVIKSKGFQDYLTQSRKRELDFIRNHPNKKPFKIYVLDYLGCEGSKDGIINQINTLPIKLNAKKVDTGRRNYTTKLVKTGIKDRFGNEFNSIESESRPIYKTVYPNDIISFAHHNEKDMCIEIHSYKK